jgi:hypothetical protein
MMDEDVLQAIFTHWIGNRWIVSVKETLQATMSDPHMRHKELRLPAAEEAKRKYFLGSSVSSRAQNLERRKLHTYNEHFFLAPMPSKEFEDAVGYDDDSDETDSDSDDGLVFGSERLSPKEVKQLLLRTLATEMLIRRSLDGEVAVVQSDFQWFATGIAHETVFAVLKFVGFQEEWISFFRKALEPPLDMLTGDPIRIRKRGLPMAHIFEKLLGELVLFFMDLAVSQQAEMLLYRFHDDLWLCGEPAKCAKAWKAMERFAEVMGLEFNNHKTGSVYLVDAPKKKNPEIVKTLPEGPVTVYFLVIDPATGNWVVNKDHVKQHAEQLQKQLGEAKSVLEWVKTWNSCIGRFFSFTFGEPANCFGRPHLDAILEVHRQIQRALFDGGDGKGKSVAEHLSHMISERFKVEDVPDAFLYMPEDLGGLGLRNPFVPLLLLSENVISSPQEELRKFHEEERESYVTAKREFEQLSEYEKRQRYRSCFPRDEEEDDLPASKKFKKLTWEEAQEFWTFEDYTKYREIASTALCSAWNSLVSKAHDKEMPLPAKVREALRSNLLSPGGRTRASAVSLDAETTWLVNFYADYLLEKVGGLRIVDKSFLPLGVLKAMRSRRVKWQMVL